MKPTRQTAPVLSLIHISKSILISCGARLAPFDIQELRDLTMYDELALDTLGDKKTALFLIMSDKMCIRDRQSPMTKPREKTREELTAEIEDGKKKIRQFENLSLIHI